MFRHERLFSIENLIKIRHFYLASCVSKIYYVHLCLFEHSCLYRWLKCCVWECVEQEKKVRCTRLQYSIHHCHWWDSTRDDCYMQRLLLDVAHIILGWVLSVLFSDFKVQRLKSIRTPPSAVLTEFFNVDNERNVLPLLVSWYFDSSSLWQCLYFLHTNYKCWIFFTTFRF